MTKGTKKTTVKKLVKVFEQMDDSKPDMSKVEMEETEKPKRKPKKEDPQPDMPPLTLEPVETSKPKRKPKKEIDPNKPKRAPSTYVLFAKDFYDGVKGSMTYKEMLQSDAFRKGWLDAKAKA